MLKPIATYLVFILAASCVIASSGIDQATGLDLSNYNFSESKKIRLDGDWAFYWDELISPEEVSQINPTE